MANDPELARKLLQVFCGGAGEQQTSVFGTMKNTTPEYSTDPDVLQGTNWPQGWQNAVAADDAPFMEDMNSLFYVMSYMIKYLYQHGIPEWSNKETYTASKSVVLRNGKFYVAKQTTGADNPQDPATDSSNTYWYMALDPVNPPANQNWVQGYAQSLANLSQTIDGSTTKYPSNKAVQTAVGDKQNTITGAATTIVSNNLTASRALVSDGSGKVAVSAVTSTELGYLDGVKSNIQTQLNGKQASGSYANTSLTNVSSNLDFVVESGVSGTSWYKKFKSGWILQGGILDAVSINTTQSKTFMKPFVDTNYYLGGSSVYKNNIQAGIQEVPSYWTTKTTTGFTKYHWKGSTNFVWIAFGQGA